MLDLVESKLSQHEAFRADVLAGLSQERKTLPSRWLYDQRGSELFEEITRLDEYYLTRTETAILRRHAEEMAALCGEGIVLLEYGAGAAIKSEILLDALHAPRMYAPIDIAARASRFEKSQILFEYNPQPAIPGWETRASTMGASLPSMTSVS